MKVKSKEERYVLFLPEDSGEVDVPKDTGIWQPTDELIKKIAVGLEVPEDASADALTAIPTVWARPILFAEALIDEGHPLHKDILREWRGLLSLFCFRDTYTFKINVTSYRIKGDSSDLFEKTLYTLKPSDQWLSINLIYLDDRLIGASSPLSLFFTSPEYVCPDSIKWKRKNGRLDDPTKIFDPMSMELYVLKKWIENAKKKIVLFKFEEKVKNSILKAFDNWLDEIKASPHSEKVKFDKPLINESPYDLTSYNSIYNQPEWSDFFLKCKIKKNPPIVYVKKIWEKSGMVYPPFNTKDISHENVPDKLEGKVKEICEAIQYEGMYLRPEYFFTKKILKVTLNDDNILLHHKYYIPPLRKEILKYFDIVDLQKLIFWEDLDDGIKVTLRLPLETREGSIKRIEISKLYKTNNIVKEKSPPTLDVWPNFIAEDWMSYYCIFEEGLQNPFACEPYPEAEEFEVFNTMKNWKMEKFPEGFCFYDMDKNPLGFLPVKQPNSIKNGKLRWFVSFDFGTSNSSVFYRSSKEDPPKRLKFLNRCFSITNPDSQVRSKFLYSSFFPPSDIDAIFPSHLRAFELTTNPEPLIGGIVFFIEPSQWMPILGDIKVHENLKWSTDESERAYIYTFLKQILLMILAEARFNGVKNIQIHHSYPSSFSLAMKEDLIGFWRTITNVGSELGANISISSPETESACICKYLVEDLKAKPAAGNRPQIVIDIGGGSTDVAIWLKNKLQVQTSLLLAGNEISSYAKKEKKFREKIRDILGISIEDKLFKNHPAAIMNILFQLYGEKIIYSIKSITTHAPEIKAAKTIIFLTISGILYYVGLLIRNIAPKNKEINSCDIYFCGNGSKFLKWIFENDYQPLLDVFKSGIGPSISLQDIKIFPAKNPKEEVARGLLYDYSTSSFAQPSVLLGEVGYSSKGVKLSWNLNINNSIDQMKNINIPSTFPELENFVTSFNSQADLLSLERIKIKPSSIKARVAQAVERYKKEKKKVLIQPLFVEEIKALIIDFLE